MISEQEAREAAARLKNGGGDAFACWEDYQESSQKDEDVEVAANWICQELARREAERAERAKPIDDEWFYTVTRGRKDIGPHCRDTGDLVVRESLVKAIKTRGQLLDLLAALKGGET